MQPTRPYEWLLFDADGTLYDFEKTETVAFQRSIEDLGFPYKPDYLSIYKQINQALWDAFERGEVAQDLLKVKRFADFLAAANLDGDATEFSQRYVGHLAEGHYLLDGAEDLVKKLARTHKLIIITNGLKEVQRPRFERSSIHDYFEAIIVSGEIGAAKPRAEIFEAAFEAMGNPLKANTLIIGDSLSSDMAGGINYGIDTCWYNPTGKERKPDMPITHEINSLSALRKILYMDTHSLPNIMFTTERLIVRQLTADDFDAMYAVYSDPEAMRWVDDGQPIGKEECRGWIDITLKNYAKYGYGMSAIEVRSTGQVIGFCGLVHPDGQEEAELKYAFLKEFWGQGFATEMAQGMIQYGHETFELTEIIATIDPENLASQRVMTKVGMTHVEMMEEDGELTELFRWTAEKI